MSRRAGFGRTGGGWLIGWRSYRMACSTIRVLGPGGTAWPKPDKNLGPSTHLGEAAGDPTREVGRAGGFEMTRGASDTGGLRCNLFGSQPGGPESLRGRGLHVGTPRRP